jgi:hypothetical protein
MHEFMVAALMLLLDIGDDESLPQETEKLFAMETFVSNIPPL